MLALVRALGRSRPYGIGRCRKAPRVLTGDFEAKIQRDNNDASSITDLSSSRRRIENETAADTFSPLGFDRHLAASRVLDEISMADRFEKWIVEYDRHYKDASEKQQRFEIFKYNVHYIEYFNAGNHMYTLGVNQFAGLTTEEVIAWHTGEISDEADDAYDNTEDEDFGKS